jgi:hypothetical protein
LHPSSYRGCWHEVSRCLFLEYRHRMGISSHPYSSPRKGVYNSKAFIPHAVSLRQAFAHCGRFPTAASRRSLGRISVPMWLIVLSDQLPIIALVSRYPTNKLIGRSPLPLRRQNRLWLVAYRRQAISGISLPFGRLSPSRGQVSYALLTSPPLRYRSANPEGSLVRVDRSTCMC